MTPALQRGLFAGFGLVVVGAAINIVFLQPGHPGGRAPDAAAARAEAERVKRLALDKMQVLAPKIEPQRSDSSRPVGSTPPQPSQTASATPPRATSSGSAPIAILPPMEAGPQRLARAMKPNAAVTDAAADTLPIVPEAEGDAETVRAVQRELSARGYGPLNMDGVPGPVTRAAIMAFEYDSRMALTGEATERVLAGLLLGASASGADPAAGRIRSAQAEIILRTVQQSLMALGYSMGRVDGRSGDETERAIRAFEVDEGLEPKGRVSAEVFSRLGRAVAAAKPQPIR